MATAEQVYRLRPALRDGDRRWTMAQLTDRSNRLAHVLRGLVGEGPANVACLVGNCGEAVELDLALLKAGLARVSINPRLAADERHHVLADSEARVLVYRAEHAGYAEEAAAGDRHLRLLRISGDRAAKRSGECADGPGLAYEGALASASPGGAWRPGDPRDPSVIMYTSGTTGRPKGAVWTNATRAEAVANLLDHEIGPRAARRMIHAGSLAHGSGSRVVPVLLRGGCNVIMPRFDPGELLRIARRQSATMTFLVPTMVQAVVDAAAAAAEGHHGTGSLTHITYGGAKMPERTLEAALDAFGPVLVQVYGSCEAPNPMLLLDQEGHAGGDPHRLASAGRPLPTVDARLAPRNNRDADNGSDRAGGGELLLRSPAVFAGYWRDEVATAAAFAAPGDRGRAEGSSGSMRYYRTGDLARIDDDGYVEIIGRVRDLIISGGYNVYPAEVERVLLEHPGVQAACVYGIDHPTWTEAVAATVVPAPGVGLAEDDLLEHCRSALAGYKLPRSLVFTDALPVGATGKVQRAEARRRHPHQ